MIQSRTILISGGGIAGLTAALALSKRGYRIDVCEKAPAFDIIGAGIQLSPNAMRILDDLGVARAARITATVPDGIVMRSSLTNCIVKTIPLGSEVIARYGMPYICLHRADLHQALIAACKDDPDINLSMNSSVTDATIHQNGVSALVMKDNRVDTRHALALVVADGVRSSLRDQIQQTGSMRHSGYQAWRAMIPAVRLPAWIDTDSTHLIMGGNAHAVLYPVNNKRYLNIVICTRTGNRDTASNAKPDKAELFKRLRYWNSQLKELFALADEWSIWPILERPQTCFWNGGPVAIIGDAAHAMPPFAAQGAAMAIEDAEVLAQSIEALGSVPEAMDRTARLRNKRIRKMRKLARANGALYHLGWPASFVRNFGMMFIPAKWLLARQSWVYDWRASDDAGLR